MTAATAQAEFRSRVLDCLGRDPEVVEWLDMSPEERFVASMALWRQFLLLGGSLDPEPDCQSPFHSLRS